jgi:cadmium resistance protein CadD (predicted permease)
VLLAGLSADIGVAAGAFISTNIDNVVVTLAMVAAAPEERSRRIALGQVVGFVVIVIVAAAAAIALFEFSARAIGILGLVPLLLGLRGLIALHHPEERNRVANRAVGRGVIAAALITVAGGGDNLAVYIPLFRVAGVGGLSSIAVVFIAGELLLSVLVLRAGGHPRAQAIFTRVGVAATPLLYCAIGLIVLWRAGTFSYVGA